MRNKVFNLLIGLILMVFAIFPAFASTVRELNWEDLIPDAAAFEDPFEAMDRVTLVFITS
jgi:hypothetical protein